MSRPSEIHFKAVKRVFNYINLTKDYGLNYKGTKPLTEFYNLD